MAKKFVKVSADVFYEMLRSQLYLSALDDIGVDDWEGIQRLPQATHYQEYVELQNLTADELMEKIEPEWIIEE